MHNASECFAQPYVVIAALPKVFAGDWPLYPCLSRCRWVSLRLQAISIAVVFATAVAVVLLLGDNPGLAGLAMTSALSTTGVLQWLVRQATRLEVQMNRQGPRVMDLTHPHVATPLPHNSTHLMKYECWSHLAASGLWRVLLHS